MNGPTIVVTGASGGLGASTLAAALALALTRREAPALLVDVDLHGGGLDVTCGIDHVEGLRWPDLGRVRGWVDPDRLLRSLPHGRGCFVLAAGSSRVRPAEPAPGTDAVGDVLASLTGRRATTVLDLPRHAGVEAPTEDLRLVVSGTRTRELADLQALWSALERTLPPTRLDRTRLVTAGPEPQEGLTAAIEASLGIAHAGHVVRAARVPTETERGEWPSGRAFREVVTFAQDWVWRREAA